MHRGGGGAAGGRALSLSPSVFGDNTTGFADGDECASHACSPSPGSSGLPLSWSFQFVPSVDIHSRSLELPS